MHPLCVSLAVKERHAPIKRMLLGRGCAPHPSSYHTRDADTHIFDDATLLLMLLHAAAPHYCCCMLLLLPAITAASDLLGIDILSKKYAEVTWDLVAAAVPPIQTTGVRAFVGSRGSVTDTTFNDAGEGAYVGTFPPALTYVFNLTNIAQGGKPLPSGTVSCALCAVHCAVCCVLCAVWCVLCA